MTIFAIGLAAGLLTAIVYVAVAGRAFLRIMRAFELTATKRLRYERALGAVDVPVQVIWGRADRARCGL